MTLSIRDKKFYSRKLLCYTSRKVVSMAGGRQMSAEPRLVPGYLGMLILH